MDKERVYFQASGLTSACAFWQPDAASSDGKRIREEGYKITNYTMENNFVSRKLMKIMVKGREIGFIKR